jgi:hypothetical protein
MQSHKLIDGSKQLGQKETLCLPPFEKQAGRERALLGRMQVPVGRGTCSRLASRRGKAALCNGEVGRRQNCATGASFKVFYPKHVRVKRHLTFSNQQESKISSP